MNKEYDLIFIDQFLTASIYYSANYGYIPYPLSKDGDPLDVLGFHHILLVVGSIIQSRPVGIYGGWTGGLHSS